MIKLTRSLDSALCLGLLALALPITTPALAHASGPVASVAQSSTKNSSKLVDQGLIAYEAGRYVEAVTAWQKAEQGFHKNGDRLNRVSTLNYLALAYQELGQWQQAKQETNQSLSLLQEQSELSHDYWAVLAQALNAQGSLQLATGSAEIALETWQQAAANYEQAQDDMGVIGSQINQAQALQSLGLYRRSQKLLEEVAQKLEQQNDPQLKALGFRSLGTTLQTIGNLGQSQEMLQKSLALTQELNLAEETSATLLSLGNTARLLENHQEAITFFQQATAKTAHPLTKLESQINLMGLLVITEQWQATEALLPQIQTDLAQLGVANLALGKDSREISLNENIQPTIQRRDSSSSIERYALTNISTSRPLIYAQVNLAKNLINLQASNSSNYEFADPIQNLLQQTLQQSQELGDQRAQSYVLGTLGHYYEQQQQWQTAQKYTEQALNLGEILNATDIAYQWQWQLGRLLQAQGDNQGAIAPYTEAVKHLQSLRGSLVAANTDAQYSFRESVEPVYRELVGLLLDADPNQAQLEQAREVIESLQLAELENFFQEACLDATPKQIDEIDASAAVMYPMILRDRLAVILSLPDGNLSYYSTELPEATIEDAIANLYQSLNPIFSNQQRLKLSEQLYDWLIRPAEAELAQQEIQTLAFVLDGSLRNIPMAALYDGQQYAIEKYNIALTPGLQLLPSQNLEAEKLQAVVAGVSESNQGFSALPGVKEEVTNISEQLSSELLLDQDFTDANLQQQLQQTDAPIVHLATHGQFSSDPEDTFIVTWNDRIQVNDFANLLRNREAGKINPIELMVLSACQTATGDSRAALGMAGIAVRSGARSTLATLWSVKDQSTTFLMDEFYRDLIQSESSVNKAGSLRQAQLALINSEDFSHPFYWSPFVLVGNWQ
ncbi:hypothetical protein Xen7305DRAFT_00022240 [Xenococcus sp. PCC 7305]|uniref:CHAT domain-containing protein n=1 Tax=Xenococcus sp. PCC 7305 TaxID=102125 RepID=UPI0002ACFBD4|nr:CHAT domain-containing protein [Xenococcus sp. PCC 7305]ELS02510.1 hypothetical protein Xen7305DRAFT_00022240 [Xenococcus sp. PCC 7305]